MRTRWNQLKNLINSGGQRDDLFLSIIDGDGLIRNANARMTQTFHLQHPRQSKTGFLELIHPDNHEQFLSALKDCARKGTWGSAEVFARNGSCQPMKWNVFPLAAGQDEVQQFFCAGFRLDTETGTAVQEECNGVHPDGAVAEQNSFEQKEDNKETFMKEGWPEQNGPIHSPAQREHFFDVFMQHTPNLAWVIDEDAKLVTASKSFYEYFNLTEEKATGRDVSALIPGPVFRVLFEKHLQVLFKNEAVDYMERVKRDDGTTFFFRINIFPITDVSGRRMIGGHAIDVEDKLVAENRLREANERLLLFSRASANAIWEWDMQTGYIFRNDALMDMIGYPQEDTKGLSWWFRRIHPEDRNRVSDKVREVTDNGKKSWEDQYRFKCADGTYKHMLDKGFVVYENGLPIRMIGSLQDVTNLKELEDELLKEKINHQKEISETAIRVQEKERTRIGHELHDNVNQIISTAKLFVDLLTPASREEKQIKEKSITYLKLAVEEIRKLSRELVTPELRENGLIKSVSAFVDDLELTTKLKIRFTHDSEMDMLEQGKQVTLFRIIQEQFKNIMNHSGAGSVELLLQKKGDDAILVIKDDGRGFNPRQAKRGIGISNIHKRARYYNGYAELKSAPGEGCVLEVFIPFS